MKLTDYIIKFLFEAGITHVFGYPGGMVTHILDSIYKNKDVEFICMHHEQAAAFAAEGYARTRNDLGVAIATSGPGATNLITGMCSAYFDSIPVIYITGQVNTYEYKNDLEIRQLGFQETDVVSIVRPITKYATRITDASMIKYELEKAVFIAKSRRPGPVVLDIPMNIQRAEIDADNLLPFEKPNNSNVLTEQSAKSIIDLLNNSQKPVFLIGGGFTLKNNDSRWIKLLETTQIPVVTSLLGVDKCMQDYKYNCGLIGAYGNRYGNYTLANSDLVISLGSRLDLRQTGNIESFARKAKLVRIDIDEIQLSYKIKADELDLNVDCDYFISLLAARTNELNLSIETWHEKVIDWKNKYPSYDESTEKIPNVFVHDLSSAIKENSIICTDVGQNQIWMAQSIEIKSGQRMLTSGGMGSMGFSLPAAIGAYYANQSSSVYSINGDGGLQMNIQELQTIVRNNIPIKIIVLNNNCLGMIRHFQEMYFDSVYTGTIDGYSSPDFCKIASAYGIDQAEIGVDDISRIEKLLTGNKPCLINVILSQYTYVFPKLSVGKPIEDQDPLLDREEFNRNMIL